LKEILNIDNVGKVLDLIKSALAMVLIALGVAAGCSVLVRAIMSRH